MKLKRLNWMGGLLLAGISAVAQNFVQVYPTGYDKTTRDVIKVSDGFLMCGMTNNSRLNDCDLIVQKTDLAGNMIWVSNFGGAKPDYAYSMVETTDGNYFIAGFTQSFGPGDYDVYLVKMNPQGQLIFDTTYIGTGNEEARQIIKTSDGNYMIVGTTNSNQPDQQIFMMKINNSGAVSMIRYYGGTGKEFGNAIQQLSDGGFVIVGQTYSTPTGVGRAYAIRTKPNGDTLWTRYFGSNVYEEAVSVAANSDDSFVVAVRDTSNQSDIDVSIYKFDANGNEAWPHKTFGGAEKDTPKTIRATSDGGFIVGAISRSFGWINPDMWLLKLNANGDTVWSRHYGQSEHEHCHMAKQAEDGGYIAVGHSRSAYNAGPNQKIMFVKVKSDGLVGVPEPQRLAGFRVYPNPASTQLVIEAGTETGSTACLINCLGQVVKNVAIREGEPSVISLNGVPSGVYIVQSGRQTQKVVVE